MSEDRVGHALHRQLEYVFLALEASKEVELGLLTVKGAGLYTLAATGFPVKAKLYVVGRWWGPLKGVLRARIQPPPGVRAPKQSGSIQYLDECESMPTTIPTYAETGQLPLVFTLPLEPTFVEPSGDIPFDVVVDIDGTVIARHPLDFQFVSGIPDFPPS